MCAMHVHCRVLFFLAIERVFLPITIADVLQKYNAYLLFLRASIHFFVPLCPWMLFMNGVIMYFCYVPHCNWEDFKRSSLVDNHFMFYFFQRVT